MFQFNFQGRPHPFSPQQPQQPPPPPPVKRFQAVAKDKVEDGEFEEIKQKKEDDQNETVIPT